MSSDVWYTMGSFSESFSYYCKTANDGHGENDVKSLWLPVDCKDIPQFSSLQLANDKAECQKQPHLEDRNMDIFGYSPIIVVRISKNILNFWILLDTPPLFLSPYLKFRGGFAPPKRQIVAQK